VLLLVGGEHFEGGMRHLSFGGDVGEQHETPGFLSHPLDLLRALDHPSLEYVPHLRHLALSRLGRPTPYVGHLLPDRALAVVVERGGVQKLLGRGLGVFSAEVLGLGGLFQHPRGLRA